MIITEYMENGSLDTFLKVGQKAARMLKTGVIGNPGKGERGIVRR